MLINTLWSQNRDRNASAGDVRFEFRTTAVAEGWMTGGTRRRLSEVRFRNPIDAFAFRLVGHDTVSPDRGAVRPFDGRTRYRRTGSGFRRDHSGRALGRRNRPSWRRPSDRPRSLRNECAVHHNRDFTCARVYVCASVRGANRVFVRGRSARGTGETGRQMGASQTRYRRAHGQGRRRRAGGPERGEVPAFGQRGGGGDSGGKGSVPATRESAAAAAVHGYYSSRQITPHTSAGRRDPRRLGVPLPARPHGARFVIQLLMTFWRAQSSPGTEEY